MTKSHSMKKLLSLLIIVLFANSIHSQVDRKVIIEHFTNTLCSTCASKNPAFYQTLEDYPDVLHIAYHPSSPYPACKFNQHNSFENDNRAYFYDVFGATPRIAIQGSVIPPQNPLIDLEQIDAEQGGSSDYKISMGKSQISDNNYKITLEVERVSGDQFETVLLYAGLVEKEIEYDAPNGENLHHDVFRDRFFFDTINVNTIGQIKLIEYEYTTDEDWNESQIYAYALIHDNFFEEILQSDSSLESINAVGKKYDRTIKSVFYPNPGSGTIYYRSEFNDRFIQAEIFDLLGNKVKEFINVSSLDMNDLSDGLYSVRLTEKEGHVFLTKILKSSQ